MMNYLNILVHLKLAIIPLNVAHMSLNSSQMRPTTHSGASNHEERDADIDRLYHHGGGDDAPPRAAAAAVAG